MRNKFLASAAKLIQILILGMLLHHPIESNFKVKNDEKNIFILEIKEVYKSSKKYDKYKVKNYEDGTFGLLYLPKEEAITIYPTDQIIISGSAYGLTEIKNPFQFDYGLFLARKNIQYSIYSQQILKIKPAPFNWKKWTNQSKESIRFKLKNEGYTTESRSIISSMLLGDRSEISEDLNESYVLTGVVHILSISGLHVVMIYMMIQFILTPFKRLKKGKQLSIILSLVIIWLFSFYVDMQPPVFRSALMITIYYLTELLKRPKNIYHTIALSAFIILIFQPTYLFDVGFQLSFSAVFFIVWLNPIYQKLNHSKNKVVQYIYDLCGTSMSAQFGTVPFATYYFNQFSGLFLFGNLFLVPASFLMIVGAILAIIISLLNFQLEWYVTIFNWFIKISNGYIKWLSSFDEFVIKQVYISSVSAVIILIVLISLRPLILYHSKKALVIILGGITALSFNRFQDLNRIRNERELIIFNQFKSTLIGVRSGQKLIIFHSENLDSTSTKNYTIRPYEIHQRIKQTAYIPIDSTYFSPEIIKTKNQLFVSKLHFFVGENLNDIPPNLPYILVRNSSFQPKNLTNLSQIKRVIADASNYPSYVNELEDLMKNHSDSILWKTSERGYFHLKF